MFKDRKPVIIVKTDKEGFVTGTRSSKRLHLNSIRNDFPSIVKERRKGIVEEDPNSPKTSK